MADALISPAVGGTMWATSSAALLYCGRKMEKTLDDFKIPLMGVMGAFIFAAQMINFTIPGTGSSGHICGSILLAALLGPYAALIVIASVLTVQALIFADGGLLALGCNIFNMGVIPVLIAYPLVYKPIAGNQPTKLRLFSGAIAASLVGLQLGAASVVIETWSSGISEFPLGKFMTLMLSIHLAIALIEGIITASVLSIIGELRPELLRRDAPSEAIQPSPGRISRRSVLISILTASLLIGAFLSWFASENPDGLEWATEKIPQISESPTLTGKIHKESAEIQQKSSLLPNYQFKSANNENTPSTWGSANTGTSLSGVIGTVITLLLATILGFILKQQYKPEKLEREIS